MSPKDSPLSSRASSIKSIDHPKKSPHAASPDSVPEEQQPKPVSGGIKLLSRMFYGRDSTPRTPTESTRPRGSSFTSSPNTQPTSNPSNVVRTTTTPVGAGSMAPPSRKGTLDPNKTKMPRFYLDPDPEAPGHCHHSHHLKSSVRQEKLSNMWKSWLGKHYNDSNNGTNNEDLSLMSGFADMKLEKKSSNERKAILNGTATFEEKYGKCQEVIGKGAFGIVRISHKRVQNGSERLFAVKEFCKREDESERKYSKRLTSEFCISSSLHHSNVIDTLDLIKDERGVYCEVMEFCAGGDLYTLILAAGKLETKEADCFFKQLMRGVNYLHEMGVAHRDLKPENLLLTTNGALKITDFGNGECFRMAWETDAHMVSGLCGSAPYIAPEEYVEKEFDARAVDVWACGVIYMAMRTGRHLWHIAKKDEDEFYARYLEGRREEAGYAPIESLNRARCRNVVYSILDPNPKRRLTASQVMKSEWGREIKVCKAGEEGI
ncbi:Serine/threonine-protein kinase hal4 [Ceratocystis fimbriata CBS 114723]|uniref:non-specific serine/threonine protein kinase n=1 Tax=Ceratocystis fimbriata CBS 114723 TaxID=1035309 RepID=A0A2C5X7I7_9PEZI|nr:Serine/threonine-protein kinase hal4 [Ceratocystis fimbriata CBS 114723]